MARLFSCNSVFAVSAIKSEFLELRRDLRLHTFPYLISSAAYRWQGVCPVFLNRLQLQVIGSLSIDSSVRVVCV